MDVESTPSEAPLVDVHRRRASYLYGLVVSGAVLATAPEDVGLVRISLALLGTLLIYWASETYVHWMTARTIHRRDLTPRERRQVVVDGWPLVTACTIPLVLLLIEAALSVETGRAVRIALFANAIMLVVVGYSMSRDGGLTGWRLAASSAAAGALGLAVVGLKTLLH